MKHKMDTEDLEKLVKISKEYSRLYNKFIGLAGISEYVHLTFEAFVGFFEDFDIEENDSYSNFKLSTRYDGVKVICLANYKEMLLNPKTKRYLEESLNG